MGKVYKPGQLITKQIRTEGNPHTLRIGKCEIYEHACLKCVVPVLDCVPRDKYRPICHWCIDNLQHQFYLKKP